MEGFKLGKLPAQFPGALRDLSFYAAGPLPKAPASVAVPSVADWGMLGNDQYGDCGVAGLEHGFMADASITKMVVDFPDDAQAIAYYLKYTGGADNGVVLSQYLAYVKASTYYGQKVTAYVPTAVHNVPQLQQVIDLFDFAYTGITVTDAMMQAFQAGEQWATPQLNSPVDGGHCIPLVGYDDQFVYAVTWGKVQPITWPMWHMISDEAWAVMTGELSEGDGRGINYAALQADLAKV